MSPHAAGLNDDRHWEPYLWIGIGVVVLIVVLVLLLHRRRQQAAIRDMGTTFTAAGFSELMDNLSWYGQTPNGPPTGEQPIQRPPAFPVQAQPGFPAQARMDVPASGADLGYRAGLQDAPVQPPYPPAGFTEPGPPVAQPYPPYQQPE